MNKELKEISPQMRPEEISTIKDILISLKPHVDVLEWGAGGSTVYFTEFLRDNNISYTWTSIEYNKDWYNKINVLTESDENIKVVLFDVSNTELKQRHTEMEDYIGYPATLGKKYDFILVDGRKRRRCLLEASNLLKPNGVALLHDARRTYYHCAFSAYPDSRILLWSGLWQGKLEDPGFIRKTLNFLHYWIFRVYTFSFRLKPKFL